MWAPQMVKRGSSKTADIAGDGTYYCQIALAITIINEGLKNVAAQIPWTLKRGALIKP